MGLLERGGLLRNDKSLSGQVRTAARMRKCPPVTDCEVKNTLKPTAKQRREAIKAAKAAKASAKLRKDAAKAAKAAAKAAKAKGRG